jgi:1-deoxy-D-xylulose-5-phosphate reductoisomerase
MQLPIAYALNKKMDANILAHVDLLKIGSLEFREITHERYPVWQIIEELLKNPAQGVVVNAANEAAIELFIEKKIGFMDISKKIITAYEKFQISPNSVADVFAIDKEVRRFVKNS